MLSQAWRTCTATDSGPSGSPRKAGPKSITGIVRVTSATSLTAIALKMFIAPSWPGPCTIPPSSARGRARVEDIAHGVAHEVERQHDDEDGQPRQQDDVRAQDHERASRRQHAAPVGGGRLGAEAQERQPRRGQDLGADVEAEGHDHRREQVWQDLATEDNCVACAYPPRGLHELA